MSLRAKHEQNTRCANCLSYVKNIGTFLVSHIGLVSMVVGYCLIGAVTFEALEKTHETKVKQNMIWKRGNVTIKLWDMTKTMPLLYKDNWTVEVSGVLRTFEMDLITAMRRDGWDGTEDLSSFQWTFAGSLFYSIVVITTIGYGHIAPKTQWGKIVTIFYAILGIPLMLLCLSNIGDGMAQSFRFIYWKVCCYVCEKKPKRKKGRPRGGRGRNASTRSNRGEMRRSMRLSQRSAESALSDSAIERSSFAMSDVDYRSGSRRYCDDMEVGLGISRSKSQHRVSEKSHLSDSILQTPTIQHSQGFKFSKGSKTIPQSTQHPDAEVKDADKTPVLYNKYARDSQEDITNVCGRNMSGFADSPQEYAPKIIDEDPSGTPSEPSSPQSGATMPRPPRGNNKFQKGGGRRFAKPAEDDFELDFEYYESDSDEEMNDPGNRPVPIWLCVVLVISYILGGAYLFTKWEKWSYLDSSYFCFITLTTIGFGDFVPAQDTKDNPEVSIALCSLYLLFGIALLAMSFNLVQEEVISNVKMVAKRLGIIKDDEEDEYD